MYIYKVALVYPYKAITNRILQYQDIDSVFYWQNLLPIEIQIAAKAEQKLNLYEHNKDVW